MPITPDFLNFPSSDSSEFLSLPTQRVSITLIWIKDVFENVLFKNAKLLCGYSDYN